jgi:hypothetical protein
MLRVRRISSRYRDEFEAYAHTRSATPSRTMEVIKAGLRRRRSIRSDPMTPVCPAICEGTAAGMEGDGITQSKRASIQDM